MGSIKVFYSNPSIYLCMKFCLNENGLKRLLRKMSPWVSINLCLFCLFKKEKSLNQSYWLNDWSSSVFVNQCTNQTNACASSSLPHFVSALFPQAYVGDVRPYKGGKVRVSGLSATPALITKSINLRLKQLLQFHTSLRAAHHSSVQRGQCGAVQSSGGARQAHAPKRGRRTQKHGRVQLKNRPNL